MSSKMIIRVISFEYLTLIQQCPLWVFFYLNYLCLTQTHEGKKVLIIDVFVLVNVSEIINMFCCDDHLGAEKYLQQSQHLMTCFSFQSA